MAAGITSVHGDCRGRMKIIIWWVMMHKAAKIKHYRVDKMLHIKTSEEVREGKEHFQKLDLAAYAKKEFWYVRGKRADGQTISQ